MIYRVTKTYGNDRGLSCCFRQWRATSHCRFLHGYSIGVEIILESSELDERNWVYDFGNFKDVKQFLEENFDHKTIVAKDDPNLGTFYELHSKGLIQLNILDKVGCEYFAYYISDFIKLKLIGEKSSAKLSSVRVFEHNANSATAVVNDI